MPLFYVINEDRTVPVINEDCALFRDQSGQPAVPWKSDPLRAASAHQDRWPFRAC